MNESSFDWQRELKGHVSRSGKPLIVILGPTASGKTAFSIRVAKEVTVLTKRKAEVVNADSRQLYRELDIGTAKIRDNEMQGVPHHLLSILDPKEEITAAQYKEMAMSCIDEIHSREDVPILVGGSMLYLRSVMDDLSFADKGDPVLRSALSREYDRDEGATLYKKLQSIDLETASAFHPRNKVYLVRALEIFETTGRTPTDNKSSAECPYDLLVFGMDVARDTLRTKIQERTRAMFEAGWVEEVKSLLKRGYGSEDPGMKSHGYREIIDFLETGEPNTLSKLQDRIAEKTSQYAKRQMTWWRGDSRIRWIKY